MFMYPPYGGYSPYVRYHICDGSEHIYTKQKMSDIHRKCFYVEAVQYSVAVVLTETIGKII